ncbi:hypothetical protein APSETT444_007839 [Aspergillus pseudonomiae]
MRDLAGAVDYTAWWIEMAIGKGFDGEPLAYIGANDIRYVAFYLACMKTGYADTNSAWQTEQVDQLSSAR